MTKAGIDATIITTNLGAEGKVPADKWLQTDYGQVIYHGDRFHLVPIKMLRSIWNTVSGCSVIHLTSLFYPPSFATALIARWHKKPLIWSPRGELDEKALVYSTWKKKPVLWLIRHYLTHQTTFHSTSPEETARVHAVLGQHSSVVEIPNFMEMPPLVKPARGRPYILCVGRIHPKKALENLIAALPFSKRFMQSDFSLKIAGDHQNSYARQLKKQVAALGLQDKVEFTGLIEGEDKQLLYAGAYVSILPSHTENFGNVVIESLAQGTPVIASKGTPWQILETNGAGFWTSNNPSELALAIENALNLSPESYEVYRKKALSLAQRHFDMETNAAIWIKTYEVLFHADKTVTKTQ